MNKQKGFSAVEGLVIVLVLTIVGFGGWYIWDQNQDDEPTTTSQAETAQDEVSSDESAPSDESRQYSGDGFSFTYPAELRDYFDKSSTEGPVTISTANGYEIGGAFGNKITYEADDARWVVSELGRFPGNDSVGDVFELPNTPSTTDVVVYDYTEGDGPFSSTTLLFVSGENMISVAMPDVCGEDCSEASKYSGEQVQEFAKQITASVNVE